MHQNQIQDMVKDLAGKAQEETGKRAGNKALEAKETDQSRSR